tara:strand:+ start:635 stop:889 length:255 start_codon:yes stop_codon:yes gene_type:complete
MPTYVYKCNACESVFEYFHSYRVKKTTCEKCGKEALQKLLNTPINIAKRPQVQSKAPGEVIKDTIEETKKEMDKDKERLRRRTE